MIDVFIRQGLRFAALPGNIFSNFVLRPLTVAPFAVAHWLSPQSFVGWDILLGLSLVLKAVAMASIVFRLGRNVFIAALAAALSILFPADTMQMSLRAIHQLWGIGLSLGGIALVLTALDRQTTLWRTLLAVAATIAFVAGGLIYEAGYLLAPAPLLILWASGETRKALGWPTAIWLAGLAAASIYLLIMLRSPTLYQQGVTGNVGRTAETLAENLPKLFTIGLYRVFLHGWYDGARMLIASLPATWPWAAGALLAFVGAALALRRQAMPARTFKWVAAGVLLAVLGYAPYLTAESHLLITQRTYNYAALGGTIAVVGLLYSVWRRWPAAGKVFAGLLLAAGLGGQWGQVEHYTNLSFRQANILANLVEANPAPPAGKTILVIDRSGSLNHEWLLKGGLLQGALTALYGRPVTSMTCVEPGLIWAAFATTPAGVPGRCVEDADSWRFGVGLERSIRISKSDILTVVVEPDLTAHALDGVAATPSEAQRKRWASILGCRTENGGCTYDPPVSDRFRYDFGDWWSLEHAPWGAGWAEAHWTPPAWQPISAAPLMSDRGQLWFKLHPRERDYRLVINFAEEVDDVLIAPYLTATINGTAVNLVLEGTLARGDVAQGVVREGLNEVTISVPFDPRGYPFVYVDWVKVSPL